MAWHLGIIEVGVIPELPLSIYLPDAPPEQTLDVPCYCYLVTDGNDCLLVDTGADPDLAAHGGLAIREGGARALGAALATERVAAGDIAVILHTHLHYDHVENDLLFPHAEVFVQRRELEWARSPGAGPFYVEVEELVDELGPRLTTVEGELELLPGIRLVQSGGHTPGHQSIVVRTADEDVCLCGDIVPMRANLDVLGSGTPDVEATRAFLARARAAGWTMIPSHDPELRGHRWRVPAPEGAAG